MEKCGATIYICLQVIEALSVFMAPVLPFSSAKLRECMNLPALADGDWDADLILTAGHKINTPEVLFPKIDDTVIEAQHEKLAKPQAD